MVNHCPLCLLSQCLSWVMLKINFNEEKKTEVTIFSTYKAIQKPQFIDASFVWPFSLLIVLASFGDLICTERPSCLMHIYCAKLETGFTRIQTVKCHSPLLHYITNFPTEGRFVCHSDSFAKAKNEFYWQDFQWYLPIRSTTPQANMNALHDLKLAAIYSDKKTIFLQIYSYSRPWKPSASGISWTPLLDCRHQIKAVTSLKIWNNETKSLRSHLVGVTPPEGVFSRIILGLACNPAKWIENIQFLQN